MGDGFEVLDGEGVTLDGEGVTIIGWKGGRTK